VREHGRTDPAAFRALIRAPRDPRVCASSLTAAPGSPGRAGSQTGDARRGVAAWDAGTPLDAVEAALGVPESSPRFNAGVGGAVQSDGVVRTDAGVMTSDREIGARLLDARRRSTRRASPASFIRRRRTSSSRENTRSISQVNSGSRRESICSPMRRRGAVRGGRPAAGRSPRAPRLARDPIRLGDDQAGGGREATGTAGTTPGAPDHDTVGAVATDGETFAAATSTGGRSFALAGRVGDVPQVGSGFFCTEAGGASATGAGEDIARVTLSRRAVDFLEEGLDAQRAADRAIEEFEEITGSGAGVIVLGDDGAGSAFNTDGMQTSIAYK